MNVRTSSRLGGRLLKQVIAGAERRRPLGIILSQKIVDSLRCETAAVRGGHNAGQERMRIHDREELPNNRWGGALKAISEGS